jgi:predicted DNA binding CopG/RHH family protein
MSKRLPVFKSDEEAEAFLDQDLTDYISAENLAPFHFELRPKEESVNLRISGDLLDAVRECAKQQGIPYQHFIRRALQRAVAGKKRAASR